jgi:hypothetical protein
MQGNGVIAIRTDPRRIDPQHRLRRVVASEIHRRQQVGRQTDFQKSGNDALVRATF